MPDYRISDVTSGEWLGNITATDVRCARTMAQTMWFNPGDIYSARVQLLPLSRSDQFVARIDEALASAGLARQQFLLECHSTQTCTEDLEDVADRTDIVWIEQQDSYPAQAGIGRRVMAVVTALADELQVTLMHNPWAQGTDGVPQAALEAWHRRLGYTWWKGQDFHIMVREPVA